MHVLDQVPDTQVSGGQCAADAPALDRPDHAEQLRNSYALQQRCAMGMASPLPPSPGYNGRTTRVLGRLRVKGDPATGLMEVGVMVKTYSLLVARLVA